jgi:hypothetical protein
MINLIHKLVGGTDPLTGQEEKDRAILARHRRNREQR